MEKSIANKCNVPVWLYSVQMYYTLYINIIHINTYYASY